MVKIGKFFRQAALDRVKKEIDGSESIFVARCSGMSSPQMTLLRNTLRASKARVFVTKNSLIRKAFKDAGREGLNTFITEASAIIFASGDVAAISKALIKFGKENEKFSLSGGFFQNQALDKKEIEKISNLPSKEILYAQVVMTLKSPLANLVFTLKGNLNKLVIALDQIKNKK